MSHGLKQTTDTNPFDLTRRELIYLALIANGLSCAEIGSRLSVPVVDIEAALFEAERKLGASNRLHAVTLAVRQGMIGIEV